MAHPAVDVTLPADLASYRDHRPTKAERRKQKIDGSVMELRIVSALVRQKYSDEEIIGYFNDHQLPSYMETGRGESWLRSLIKKAQKEEKAYRSQPESSPSIPPQPLRVVEKQHTPSKKRTYASPVLPFHVLHERLEGEVEGVEPLLTEWYQEIIQVSSRSAVSDPVGRSAARDLAGRLRAKGYVTTRRLPGNRQRVLLTEKGRRCAEPIFGRWARFLPIYEPHRGSSEKAIQVETVAHKAGQAKAKTQRRPPSPPSPQRKRALQIVLARKHDRINGHYRLSFRGNRIRHVQLLVSPDEWVGATVWENLVAGLDADGLETFVWVEADSDADGLIRRMLPDTWRPHECVFAPAVELAPNGDGYEIATYVEQASGEILPCVGIIEQSMFNFYNHILKLDDPQAVLRVKGTGEEKERMFEITRVADQRPIQSTFDFDPFLQSLDFQNHSTHLDQLPHGWFQMPQRRKQLVWRLLGLEVPLQTAHR